MPPLITTPIGPQQFEQIRDRIGVILENELPSQLAGDAKLAGVKIWIERFIAYGKEELPAINIRFAPSEPTGHTVLQQDGAYLYHIEVFTNAANEGDSTGDTLATIRNHKLLGLCRAILMNDAYKLLGYEPGNIVRRRTGKIEVALPDNQGDGLHTVYGRIALHVEAPEGSPLKTAVPFAQNTTTIKLDETNKGFQVITPQP